MKRINTVHRLSATSFFLKNDMFDGEPDIVGLSDEEADELMTFLEETFKKIKEQAKAEYEALYGDLKGEQDND